MKKSPVQTARGLGAFALLFVAMGFSLDPASCCALGATTSPETIAATGCCAGPCGLVLPQPVPDRVGLSLIPGPVAGLVAPVVTA